VGIYNFDDDVSTYSNGEAPNPGMNGQWVGTYMGSSSGQIVLNVDERSSFYEGTAHLLQDDQKGLNAAAAFHTTNKENKFQFRTDVILGINPISGAAIQFNDLKDRNGGEAFPQYADVSGEWNSDTLKLSWVTDTAAQGSCILPKSRADQPSELVAQVMNWVTYKEYVSTLKESRYLFRGQNEPWRLRTSFHRTGRANLSRFLNEDVQMLHKHLSARTNHVFNLEIPNENGAFFNLIQHHGYPTPLLDWTYSPYVAAFFAYRGISNRKAAAADPKTRARIHVFDQARWRTNLNQLLVLIVPGLHLSIGEFLAIENERMIPQQAASTVTNVDDIETYIRSREVEGNPYLWAIDLPIIEREHIVRDLGFMGITAGSLFPGLDGACEELAERNFNI
jgi:hypothetical protein